MKVWQQGDVILKRIKKLPDGLKAMADDARTLQRGEVTGHAHRFTTNAAVKFYAADEALPGMRIHTHDGVAYIEVLKPSALLHEEHKTIDVPPGCYQVDLVREFDYEEMETKRVVD